MSGTAGGGDNYTGLGDEWGIDPSQASWMAANQGTPTWDGSGTWDTGQSWWERNTPSAATMQQINAMRGGLATLKPLPDAGSGMPARPPFPAPSMHQGQGTDALAQYLQMLQQRQQQMRTQFLPKTAGLLGG